MVLLLPGRIVVGAVAYFVGAGLTRREGYGKVGTVVGGCVGVLVGQMVVEIAVRRGRKEEKEEEEEEGSGEMMAWLEAIQAVGRIVERFSEGLQVPGVKHLFLDTTLVRLLHESLADGMVGGVGVGEVIERRAVLMQGRYYLEYALSTYGFMLLKLLGVMDPSYDVMVEGMRGVDVARYILRLKEEDMIVSCLDGEGIKIPRHFVALDHDKSTIVIAIRGTNSISDIITDLLCENVPFAGGYAHAGMKEAADALFVSIIPTLRNVLKTFPRYSLVTTGHSLGAGVAILLTKLLIMNEFKNVKCYAIAPCPVFGPMHKVDKDWSDALECFVHNDDLVAKLCLASARDLALEMRRIDSLNLTTEEKKQMIHSKDLSDLDRRLVQVRSQTKYSNVEQLYIPTHSGIHWLIPAPETDHRAISNNEFDRQHTGPAYQPKVAYNCFNVQPNLFERLLITPRCVNSHFPNSYTRAFAGLDLPPQKRRPPQPSERIGFNMWNWGEFG